MPWMSGGVIGAGGGAAIGAIAGNAGLGAGAGLVGGYLYEQNEKAKRVRVQRRV